MTPRKKHTVFLSRVSSEFKELTDRVRSYDDAYPWLRLIDQEAPGTQPTRNAAPLTVAKIKEWISDSDTVFHYVGLHHGATAKVPITDCRELADLLDASCYKTLESLRLHFRNSLPTDSPDHSPDQWITYTMLEAVLAIGLGKELLIFWLDPKLPNAVTGTNHKPDPIQEIYREWLKRNHIPGRDRLILEFPEDMIVTSTRKLQSLDRAVSLEFRANFAQNYNSVWESVAAMADPDTTQNERANYWSNIRQGKYSCTIDWIGSAVEISDPSQPHALAPEPIFFQVPDSEKSNEHSWLIPIASKLHRLRIDQGVIQSQPWPEIGGHSFRACCLANLDVWVLCESDHQYFLHCLKSNGSSEKFTLHGFQTHGFHPVHLTCDDGSFYLTYQGQMRRISFTSEPNSCNASTPLDSDNQAKIESSSRFVEQLSLPRSFPFRRGFHGQTYDSRIHNDTAWVSWAVVKERQKIHGITINPGGFLDLFKTVDVTFTGPYEATHIKRLQNGIVVWEIYPADDTSPLHLPLFHSRRSDFQWVYRETDHHIFRRSESETQVEQVLSVLPNHQGGFVPSCFIQHSKIQNDNSRFRVWLLPKAISSRFAQCILPFTQHLTPLPKPPIDSMSSLACANFSSNDDPNPWIATMSEWHQTLWNECQE